MFWSLPADRAELRAAMENMMFDPSAVTDGMIEGRWDLLAQDGYAEYFGDMFAPPRQRYLDSGVVTDAELRRCRIKKSRWSTARTITPARRN